MAFKSRYRLPPNWLVYTLAGLIVLVSVYTITGDRGAVHLWRLRGEKAKLDDKNFRLQKDNEALAQRISQLRNSNYYLEKLAREELNLARRGEVIYRFPPAGQQSRPPSEVPSDPSAAGQEKR